MACAAALSLSPITVGYCSELTLRDSCPRLTPFPSRVPHATPLQVWEDAEIDRYIRSSPLVSPADYSLLRRAHVVEKTDLFRLLVLYHEGGLYMDMDRPYNRPMREVLASDETRLLLPLFEFDFVQDMMCSAPGNPMMRRAAELNMQRRREIEPRRNRATGYLEAHDVYRLGPMTWFHAATESLFGELLLPMRQPFLHMPLVRPLVVARALMRNVTAAVQASAPLIVADLETPCHTLVYQAPHAVCLAETSNWDKHALYRKKNVSHWVFATENGDDPSEVKAGVELPRGVYCARTNRTLLSRCRKCSLVECEYDCMIKIRQGLPCHFISYDSKGGGEGHPRCLLHTRCERSLNEEEKERNRVANAAALSGAGLVDHYLGQTERFWNLSALHAIGSQMRRSHSAASRRGRGAHSSQPGRALFESNAQGGHAATTEGQRASSQTIPAAHAVHWAEALAAAASRTDYASYRRTLAQRVATGALGASGAMRAYCYNWWHPGKPHGIGCGELEHVGGDGGNAGKALCAPQKLLERASPCHIISVGSDGDAAFEADIHERAPHCRIDTYDGTLVGPHRSALRKRIPPYVHFHAENWGRETWREVANLTAGSGRGGDGAVGVAILKMDCESCELDALPQLLEHVPVTQIVVETHGCQYGKHGRAKTGTAGASGADSVAALSGVDEMHKLMTSLWQLGYRVFAREDNILWSDGTCIEFSLMRA